MKRYILKNNLDFLVLDYTEKVIKHYEFSRFIKRKKFDPSDIYNFWRHFTLCSSYSFEGAVLGIYTEDNGWRELRPGDSYDG